MLPARLPCCPICHMVQKSIYRRFITTFLSALISVSCREFCLKHRWNLHIFDPMPISSMRNLVGSTSNQQITTNIDTLDWLIMPCVAYDTRGYQLGMGGGYYDRALEECAPMLPVRIGVAHLICKKQCLRLINGTSRLTGSSSGVIRQ